MTLKWHPSLTADKWAAHPLEARVAMVQDEISRARNSRAAGYYGGTQLALERALELLDLTVETLTAKPGVGDPSLRTLLRWRERIARAHLLP